MTDGIDIGDLEFAEREVAEIEQRAARQRSVIADLADHPAAQAIACEVLDEIEVNLTLARTALIALRVLHQD